MDSRQVCVLALAALASCTAGGPRAEDTATDGMDDLPGDIAGNQSGTEGKAACSCILGAPREEVALDGAQCADYPFAYTPNEILTVIEGAHEFACPGLNVTARVEITRGAGARILDGMRPADTDGDNGATCSGLELDATLRLRTSDGLIASADRLRYGSQCEIAFRGTLVSVASGDVRGELASQPVDIDIMLWNTDTLILQYAEGPADHCRRVLPTDPHE